jgi:ABC-type multidrug transport system fused ATPase/permease subunit
MFLIFSLLWRHAKRHPWRTGITMALVMAVAALWIAEPLYAKWAVDTLLGARDGKTVPYAWVFGGWAALVVTMAIVQALEKYWTWEIDNMLVLERRQDVYEKVLHLDVAFHTSQKSGEVIKILDEGADQLMDMQREIFVNFLPSLIAAVVFLIIGFTIEPILVGILCVTLSLFFVVVVLGIKKTVHLQHQINKLWVESIGRAYDAVLNISSVKSGAQEGRELKQMEDLHIKAHGKQSRVNYRWALIESMNFFLLTRVLLIGVGILLYAEGRITLGELYFFQSSFFRVLTPFEILSGILPQWNKRLGKIRMSEEIYQTPIFVRNDGKKRLPALRGEIALEDVCFSYEGKPKVFDVDALEVETDAKSAPPNPESELADETIEKFHEVKERDMRPVDVSEEQSHSHDCDVLESIDLVINAGEKVAFVGHSGAGKTTMAMLLTRFYDVSKGRIVVDGTDLRQLDLQWWRSHIGLVLQDNILFNDSVLENIRYARPSATKEDVIDAARRAAAHEFIEKLPKGYDTLIGDRGIRLSGGQRQRVAIARAILKDPAIVILDEATSALDSVTERAVQQGIESLTKGRTSCIIAHRLSTVRSADRIAVLDKGKLIAYAPHEELMKTCAIYKEMVELQSQGMLAES